jgi:hypothetical protein
VVPAVLMVLAMCLGGMQVAGTQLRLQDATADASALRSRGDLVCVDARAPAAPGIGWMSALTVSASGCAVDGGL